MTKCYNLTSLASLTYYVTVTLADVVFRGEQLLLLSLLRFRHCRYLFATAYPVNMFVSHARLADR